jgi:hypothetical protein
MRFLSLLPALSLAACAGPDAKRAAIRNQEPVARTSVEVPADVHGICMAVATFWRQRRAQVRVADSQFVPPLGDRAQGVCVVHARQDHGAGPMTGGSANGADAGRGPAPALIASTGPEWVSLLRYNADGPDGSLAGYQRGGVRCTVASSWDGGDDSDSTYVPEDWYTEETDCWPEPGGIAVTDTAP